MKSILWKIKLQRDDGFPIPICGVEINLGAVTNTDVSKVTNALRTFSIYQGRIDGDRQNIVASDRHWVVEMRLFRVLITQIQRLGDFNWSGPE